MTTPEFSRIIDIGQCDGRQLDLSATEAERSALAARFDLVRIDRLEARVLLSRKGQDVEAKGTISANYVQSCAVSAEDIPVSVDEDISFRFVPERGDHAPDEELEIDADDCDEIEYRGTNFDLGEAVSQSLALTIDPYATGPQADEARARFRDADENPFAALKGFGNAPDEKDPG